MKLFFTDLDNTLIYSHRHLQTENVRWVETLHNKLQSFMTEATYEYFSGQIHYSVVPVTTRTYEQYIRLMQMSTDLRWNNALICNGAILLHNNEIVPEWSLESIRLSSDAEPYFVSAYSKCKEVFGETSIILTDHFMFYIKGVNVAQMYPYVQGMINTDVLEVMKDSRKIYIFPKILNKGTAIKRYMKLVGEEECVAAGDSEFDVPMLETANVSLCSSAIKGMLSGSKNQVFADENFSDRICAELKKISMEGVSV